MEETRLQRPPICPQFLLGCIQCAVAGTGMHLQTELHTEELMPVPTSGPVSRGCFSIRSRV